LLVRFDEMESLYPEEEEEEEEEDISLLIMRILLQ